MSDLKIIQECLQLIQLTSKLISRIEQSKKIAIPTDIRLKKTQSGYYNNETKTSVNTNSSTRQSSNKTSQNDSSSNAISSFVKKSPFKSGNSITKSGQFNFDNLLHQKQETKTPKNKSQRHKRYKSETMDQENIQMVKQQQMKQLATKELNKCENQVNQQMLEGKRAQQNNIPKSNRGIENKKHENLQCQKTQSQQKKGPNTERNTLSTTNLNKVNQNIQALSFEKLIMAIEEVSTLEQVFEQQRLSPLNNSQEIEELRLLRYLTKEFNEKLGYSASSTEEMFTFWNYNLVNFKFRKETLKQVRKSYQKKQLSQCKLLIKK